MKSKIGGDEPRALEDQEIEAIIQRYVDAARRTKDAGFDGVDLVALGRSLLADPHLPRKARAGRGRR